MGKHGETEFDTIDMDILVLLVMEENFLGGRGEFLNRGVWEGEIDSWLLADY